MKHHNRFLVVILMLFGTVMANAQDENNPWAIEIGTNAVDTYPIGVDDMGRFSAASKGELFTEYFNVEDHWNILPVVSRVAVSRYIGSNFSFGAAGSVNNITKIGELRGDDLSYYAADGEIRYSLRDIINGPGGWFDLNLGIGGGYTWIDDIGFGTANGLVGFRFWLGENIGLNFQSTYKYAFEETFGVEHFQHSGGVVIKFGGRDADGDGIYDIDDECPETPGLPEFNGCPDTDGDGIEDRKDDCPNQAGLPELNGCPDTDSDGIPDPQDACPTVPGLATLNGCPDTDGDGITDAEDQCPNEAGPRTNNGCPWPDSDEDGVLDKDDECPDVVGTVANNGCPEVTGDVMNELNSRSKTIYFDYDKATVRQESFSALQDIASIMNEYPNTRFHIEGHTDSVGGDAYNLKLSKERAASVMAYLTT
ncbi:MAG: OmpA family protein, partial [Marinirhabdus sp.]